MELRRTMLDASRYVMDGATLHGVVSLRRGQGRVRRAEFREPV
jgi:hypothetical protein